MKVCAKCKQFKEESEFYRQAAAKDGLQAYCKLCSAIANPRKNSVEYARQYRTRHPEKVRVTNQAYVERNRFKVALWASESKARMEGYVGCLATEDELEAAFDGVCKICGVPEIECNRKLCMDHNHTTGEFRFWLCDNCNRALGAFRDRSDLMRRAADLLDGFRRADK